MMKITHTQTNKGRFNKGHIPWNKGKHHASTGNSLKTQFKKGQKPKNHRPVGSTRITKDGYIEIKIAEGMRQWRLLHREVWKKHHGSYPTKGQALIFIDGNKRNCDILNLRLVSRTELMSINSVHNYPKEIVQLIQLRGAIQRKINGK